ncbi:hypothetical protein [Micromonospora sp. CA-246542]|uniref:hypothetical protein n=1 Tax=Micromonospora sp. CA-246542 TaxID=3239959 RepID=UPI003D8E4BB0
MAPAAAIPTGPAAAAPAPAAPAPVLAAPPEALLPLLRFLLRPPRLRWCRPGRLCLRRRPDVVLVRTVLRRLVGLARRWLRSCRCCRWIRHRSR